MESYKNSYKIIRIGSYPTKEQHGRGRHNIELSRVYTAGTLFITWNTRETLMHELSDLDVKCFSFYDRSVRSSISIFTVYNKIIRLLKLLLFSIQSTIFSFIRSPKIVHLHSPMFLLIAVGLKILSNRKIIVLLTFHGEDYIHSKKSWLIKLLIRRFVNGTLFISSTQLEDCDFSSEKYWTPNGIEPKEWAEPNKSERRNQSVISVGKFKPQKNFLGLVSAWSELHKEFPDARLTIVGEGEQQNEIELLIKKLNLCETVTILPFQDQKSLKNLYWSHQIFISNSIWEGFAKVVLEALASNCRIGVTAVDSHKRMFSSWPYLITPGDIKSTEKVLRELLTEPYDFTHHQRILEKCHISGLHTTYKDIINGKLCLPS